MTSQNTKKDVELKMAGGSVAVALLVFIFLHIITKETSRLRGNRLQQEKLEKCKKIQAEQREAIENYERQMNERIGREENEMYVRSNSWENASTDQRFSMYEHRPPLFRSRSDPVNQRNSFSFEPMHIAEMMRNDRAMNGVAGTPRSGAGMPFSGPGTPLSGRGTPQSEAMNYREWSLRRRDVQLSLMND